MHSKHDLQKDGGRSGQAEQPRRDQPKNQHTDKITFAESRRKIPPANNPARNWQAPLEAADLFGPSPAVIIAPLSRACSSCGGHAFLIGPRKGQHAGSGRCTVCGQHHWLRANELAALAQQLNVDRQPIMEGSTL
jgi:hypothetical protein